MAKFTVQGLNISEDNSFSPESKTFSGDVEVWIEGDSVNSNLSTLSLFNLGGKIQEKASELFKVIEDELNGESEVALTGNVDFTKAKVVGCDCIGRPVFEFEDNGETNICGKLVVLHAGEAVLNLIDTKKLLSSIDIMDDLVRGGTIGLPESTIEHWSDNNEWIQDKMKAIDEEENKYPKLTKDEADRIMKAVEKVEEMSKITEIKVEINNLDAQVLKAQDFAKQLVNQITNTKGGW